MSDVKPSSIPGARSLRPRLQVVNAWRWDGTHKDAALMGQWLRALGVSDELTAHYRNRTSTFSGVSAYVQIDYQGEGQAVEAGEWLIWLGGDSFMVMEDSTRRAMFATDEAATIVIPR